MNKSVQILILLALFPMLGMAREETLEERKQRIVRKYLRERMTIEQSTMVVPSDLPEDERITDSEKYIGVEVDLQRQGDSPTPMVPPPQQRSAPRRTDSNWLMGDVEEVTDAYGNPVDQYSAAAIDSGDELWSVWDGTSEKKTATEFDRQDRRSYDPNYGRENAERGSVEERNSQNALYGNQQNSGFGRANDSRRTDIFGRKYNDYSSRMNLQDSRTKTYGSDPAQGMLASPYPQLNSQSQERKTTEQERRQSYTPYKSPYDKQREQRSQQMNKPSQQQEFKRPDSYQQWKERNKTYDPTADDAYINEMMKQNRR